MEAPLPNSVSEVVDVLSSCAGVRAVTVGGSRAAGVADDDSDWDLGVFYRGTPDLRPLERLGEVHPPGSWGRLMNGGAWLNVGGLEIDVILRDLDSVEDWTQRAREGVYEVDNLLGYLAGFPTYTLTGEVAASCVVFGSVDLDTSYPEALAVVGERRWGFQREFSLDYALMHARRGNELATVGNLARASMEEGHRRMCAGQRWVLNEKRLLADAGLVEVLGPGRAEESLTALAERCRSLLRP